jgi:GNAT superfamily N-acetyltransferase
MPEDKPLLLAGFRRLSAESRYARFFAPKDTLSEDELRYLTELDHERHFAIGALAEDGDGTGASVGVGVARFIRLPDPIDPPDPLDPAGPPDPLDPPDPPGIAEAAIAVLDDMHGRGLGKLLFLRLCAAAAERGIARFRCEVLGSNTGMRALIEDISPDPQRLRIESSGGIMTIDMALPDVDPAEPPAGPAPAGPAYRLFRAAAENAIEWTLAVQRLWRGE